MSPYKFYKAMRKSFKFFSSGMPMILSKIDHGFLDNFYIHIKKFLTQGGSIILKMTRIQNFVSKYTAYLTLLYNFFKLS